MIDFIEYVVSELKNRRLSKENAVNLIRQFSGNGASGGAASLHPLLHRNVSDMHQQCYRSSFTGDEFFLNDHRVLADGGPALRVLPGVAYLEMARAALADAMPGAGRIQLNDVVWVKPLVVGARQDVCIALSSGGNAIEFEIFSDDADGEEVVHCRGSAIVAAEPVAERLDVDALTARMGAGQLDAGAVYPAYRAMGMQFGPGHQALTLVDRGEREVVARLTLPASVADTLGAYELHPSLMDGALQAAIGLLGDLRVLPSHPSLPFALESVRILSACTREMVAWIRHAQGAAVNDKVARLDIDLCDADGKVCVQLRGFSSRTLSVRPDARREKVGLVLANPVWTASPRGPVRSGGAQRHVLFCDLAASAIPDAQVHHVTAAQGDVAQRYIDLALGCFDVVREIIANRTAAGVFIQLVVPDAAQANLLAGLSGLLKSAALEHPDVQGQLLLVDALAAQEIHAEPAHDAVVRYRNGVREAMGWEEAQDGAAAPAIAFKEGGVYLITGGLGGLGSLFAQEIVRQTAGARVVLTGRSASSQGVQDKLDALSGDGRIEYRTMDLTHAVQVRQVVADIVAAHGQLNGILHSAGMVADSLIVKKTRDEFAQVLAPKVSGTVNLDAASGDVDLDFMALFSSGASVMGNVGQADYAVANGFLDQFAEHRNRLAAAGQRKGRTIAINWPLWAEGGMRMPQRDQDAMREHTGMHPMQTGSGMHAFLRCLEGQTQTVAIEGDMQKIRQVLFEQAPGMAEAAAPVAAQPAANLHEQTRDYLRKQFAELFKLPYGKVDPRAALEKYGIDSILSMDLTRQLEKTFGPLSKTLFFEHQSIDELTDYFVRSHAPTLATLFSVAQTVRVTAPPAPPLDAAPRKRSGRGIVPAAQGVRHDEAIAIVGLSGRYPESPDLEAFWDNLRDGKDCIVEIPKERWDWRDYYSEDRTAEGCHYSKWGGFISGVDEFDPLFFNIPPVDAEMIDPQERLFLQHTWMAIEDAGYTRAALKTAHRQEQAGQVGVYVGVMYGEYQLFGAEASLQGARVGVPVSYASIANRVSYILNLHGPSMTLDTMCSSSLTAIHLACQDLKQGRTHLAIAGGINVSIHPNKYLILSAGQFISSDGHCQSFGEGGDGYIPGEGVGAVVLKRLSDAERDGNHIYGVIKGSALNHGGKTNGYSVPNPKAQANVIGLALKEYGIDARHVSYIEAHGTGTRLGDPIEIAALSQVFGEYTKERQFCAIGSAKSNIGHCESAAGIAGLTKVLLQMKHRMIVPSLHSSVLNPYIDFAASPFVVNQALRAWEQPEVDGRRVPRIAGISSFGAGGSNAHLIVEEYAAVKALAPQQEAVVIVLSARTPAQLKRKASELLAFIERQDSAVDLDAMAYTLQVGREVMDARLALVVDSVAQLAAKLAAFGRGEDGIDQFYLGQADKDKDKDGMSVLSQDDDMMETIAKWIARKKLPKLAELWVNNLEIDWRRLHTGRKPALISLPAYPFAKDRYWISRAAGKRGMGGAALLHPLVHANTSDFVEQRYSAHFSGDEFFLADHRIGAARQKILPGVAYLEMVRAAVELAMPAGGQALTINNVVWTQPIVVDGGQEVSIALAPRGESTIDFEVHTGQGGTHCQGQVVLSEASGAGRIDLAAIRAGMHLGELDVDTAYGAFRGMHIHYGPSFRCMTALARGEGQVLAELTLQGEADGFTLHPGMFDSALQASIGLVADIDHLPGQPSVPFALDSLAVHRPFTARMFAWVRRAGEKIDIDLCEHDGTLCARLAGLASRAMQADDSGTLIAVPRWEPAGAAHGAVDYSRHVVLLCDLDHIDPDRMPAMDVRRLTADGAHDAAARYSAAAIACFEQVQAMLTSASSGKMLFQLVIGGDSVLAGLSGLIDTARLENPDLIAQLIVTERHVGEAALAAQLRESMLRSGESVLKHEGGLPTVRRWMEQEAGAADVAFKDGGVYLITGGTGGLGLLFARAIVDTTSDAVVVLSGRAAEHALPMPGGRVVYRQLDLTQPAQVRSLVDGIVSEFGALNGVIHSAGMTRDNFIINKTSAQFAQVLAPKVAGTVNLDSATRHLNLDFMVLFSSLASAMGNAGQADYAAANGFMDQFAAQRKNTVSINWPLWQDGGMRLDADTLAMLADASGMQPLTSANGMQAFYRSVALGTSQALVIEGRLNRLRRALAQRHAPVALEPAAVPGGDAGGLLDSAQQYLVDELASLLKMPSHEVDPKAPLEQYGMDSVLAMKLTKQLERTFGSLSKTLFFEYQTIARLAGYLAKAFPHVLAADKAGQASAQLAAAIPIPAPARSKLRFAAQAPTSLDVAIVGVAGRYPQANNLREFWQNLQSGRDCITEIPDERWDHAPFYTTERNQPGKAYSKWGGFIDGVDQFDALFFNISPKEAELIDPQERLFIETVWETIEDAGYSKDAIARNRVGVYVGVMWGQYELYGAAAGAAGTPSSSFASIANRVSYFFNFQGPSLALDTMCSSSLTAIHLATEEVRKGGVDLAIAGGVNVSIHPNKYLSLSQGNFASTDGRCRSFGDGGDGYVPGEGVGAVLLKPLDKAIADGDQIYAIVKSSAINHGGKTNGYTVPNPVAQSALILEALGKAGIDPATISYIETHGTGTSLGDPIEVTGLVQAFEGAGRPLGKQRCPIGSVKSNIGHLESAAGIAALTKVLLQMKHGQLVPSLHAEQLNPHIDFPNTPFYVQTALQEWKRPDQRPRRVGVSSFGAGGSNAHLILEDFVDKRVPAQRQDRPYAFVMSARNRDGLLACADRMLAFLDDADEIALADMAFTSQLGRTAMQERLAVVAASKAELKAKLRQWRQHGAADDVLEGSTKNARAVSTSVPGLTIGHGPDSQEGLAAQWVCGVDVDWARLYGTERMQRVSLPTYPFARERFWMAAGMAPVQAIRKQLLHYRTEWRAAQPLVAADFSGPLLVVGADLALFAQIERLHPGATQDTSILPAAIVHVADAAGSVKNGIFALHALCQSILKRKPTDGIRIVSVRAGNASAAQHRGTAGYLKSLALENPQFSWKTIEIDGDMARIVSDELRDAHWRAAEVRYRGAQREVRETLRAPAGARARPGAVIKHNGVYIITGGMGGLGELFSQYLRQQYGARLVLTGRSAPPAGQRSGDNVMYVQADIADRSQVDALVREARHRFGRIDGVIHSAGVHRDAFVLNKTRAEMEAVFAAKVDGTINLDLATRDDDLDLFVTFSSVAGALGNVGQSDYAFANAFMDGYAEQRQGPGKSLSINWPLWQDGGMQLSQGDVALMEERSGLSPLPSNAGIGFFESALQGKEAQAIALYGDATRIEAYLARGKAASARVALADLDAQPLREATEHYLKTLLSEQIKLAVERIDAQERFDAFGVDSMMISRINADLERDLGELPKTLFYEYATIEELAGYLVQQAHAALARRFKVAPAAPVPLEAVPAPAPAPPAVVEDIGAIAIIGVNGQFPQSATLAAFWENLSTGRDLIAPVPASRWDAAGFFDADPQAAEDGKIYCTSGGFLDDVDKFDAAFFSISPDDARMIDPQERMFIQSVWGAVEDAGYTRDSLKKHYPKAKSADVGVFVGVTTNSYHLLTADEWSRGNMVNPAALPWSIANRVSYFFDFQGPSMPVDTACSSALVAIHMACESLKRKDCQLAVAGGVNLYLHPAKYQSLCRKRMLAVDGKCRSFGDGDDGFIPGEGVGAFLLKPLARAVADNDHIYGVVAASAYQHSGRSNGYSAPNPNSQAQLIEQVMSKAGIGPDEIGYVEGHGTGTRLGDSLEVLSMTQAFRKRSHNKAFCPLGSVKANVGHAESAAGIAGVAKILLQFKHRQIAPTIHSDIVNPNIDFASSPFYLQHALTPWDTGDGQARRALINSFGAGGVNACLILEQYQRPAAQPACAGKAGYLMVLSARDAARLKERAAQLRDYLTSEREIDLAALSYTLQVGREAMDERLAMVVASAGELLSGLSAYIGGKAVSALSLATLEPHRKKKGPNQDERGRTRALFDKGDMHALMGMWIEGRSIEWEDFYRGERPFRLPLPSYPFAKERYWVSDAPAAIRRASAGVPGTQLHPLVSSNASTLREVSFASNLSGDAFYGRDHQVNGERFFPGAGFLELACVTGTIAGEESVLRIEDIVWVQPLKLGKDAQQVKTFLKAIGSSTEFVIVSFDDDNERVVHAEGRMSHGPASRHGAGGAPAYPVAQLKQRAARIVQGADCYRALASAGFHYGPCFQTIQELHIGSDFVLSRLQLADQLRASFDQYILHPSIIDGALQTVVGMAAGETPDTPYLPFALDDVELLRPLPETCYAYVEHAGQGSAANQDIKQFNICLLSESGEPLVRLNNFYLRALPGSHMPQGAGSGTLVLPE
ncbi:SDR family NAD(P)-dependent oxidoreductase [Massilia atriviolacea]|uniref:SDR family NAD(P)-dependent oxidoreductase n=1 Tax=Massilia atriviolacea TaxID=2495579 RepID=A0A430HS89_9BURK|nr:SDR family NAD(P)-dependent oxidoreductase [Massilia atriviolacea]RSZ60418.1 SDR family NAD(P)-dependent oxidoreductase [Massilia atriviolacea]